MDSNRNTANPLDGAVFQVQLVQLGSGISPERVLSTEIISSPRLDDTYTVKAQSHPIDQLATPIVVRVKRLAYNLSSDLLTRSLSAIATVELSRN